MRQDDLERVISDRGRFRIVEKVHQAVRRTVERLDGRTRPGYERVLVRHRP